MDMEVYIKELICSSILGLNYKNSKKKKKLSTKELWKFFKSFMFLEKKKRKRKKEKRKERKYSL